ncbi:MAG: glycosyltransferase family 39 protein [Acidimicrobiales bacterium]
MPVGLALADLRRPLFAITVAYLALMLAWSVVMPTFRGADEHIHHDFLRHLTETWDYPDFDELSVSWRTALAISPDDPSSPVYPAHAPAAREDQATPRSERDSWTEVGPDDRGGFVNQLAQHPPLYYVPTAAVLRVIDGDGSAPLDRVVWQLRLLNILVLVPLPLLAADIARRFTSSKAAVLGAAAVVVAVPQLAQEGATLSNDPLMILLGSVTLAGVARLLTGDLRWATAVVTGVAAGLALLTKGFAVPLVPAVALAALVPLWRSWRGDTDATGPATGVTPAGILARASVIASLALVSGGWWWIRNVVVHGNPQPGIGTRPRVEGVEADVVAFAGNFADRLVSSFWGNVGWREAHLPIGLSALLTVALVVAVGLACWRRWERLVLLVPTVVAGLMVVAAGWGAYRKTGVSYATQGRYLFTSIAALAALASLGVTRYAGRFTRWLPVTLLAVGFLLQAVMLVIAVRRYWAGGGLDRLGALVAFSPLPDVATTGILLLVPVTAVVALASFWRDSGVDASAH